MRALGVQRIHRPRIREDITAVARPAHRASAGKAIADADSLCAVVANVEGVMTAAPTIEERALAIYGPHQMPVTLKGVTPDYDILTAYVT